MQLAPQQFLRQRLEHFGWRRLIDKMKTGLTGLGHNGFDAVHQRLGGSGFVAAYVVEADIAEAAFFPVTTLCNRQLVPAPVAPQTVHGVEHV